MEPKETQPRTFTTVSGVPVERLYTEQSLPAFDFARDLGEPGEPPYTRGIDPAMYRDHLWTMRQPGISGTPVIRFGKGGVAVESLADMETLFHDIPLDSLDVSLMTDATVATLLWAMYLVVAEKQGVPWNKLRGTIQNDILEAYAARKKAVFPPRPSMKLIVDSLEFALRYMPEWNPILISGYQIREAGSTALQELAFTLYDGIEYTESAIRSGLNVDTFAPRLSFFFDVQTDLFEEIAKFRTARKVWHRVMTERFKCRNPQSAMLRFHAQTSSCSLTGQQAENNIVRVAIQALAAVMGGTQSLHTNAMDEAQTAAKHSARIALRTQQILAHESGITHTVDPFGGSYFLERLTLDMERGCWEYFERLDAMGGMIAALEQSYPQREIEKAAHVRQKAVEDKEKIVVGVNDFVGQDELPIQAPQMSDSNAQRPSSRDDRLVRATLDKMRNAAAESHVNMVPAILDCVRAYATVTEMCGELRTVYGACAEPGGTA